MTTHVHRMQRLKIGGATPLLLLVLHAGTILLREHEAEIRDASLLHKYRITFHVLLIRNRCRNS